ncbi:MAG: hypothetical protein RLZZ357_392 [Bacteroidota bacterium]|jgi:hypothetical protein
MKFGAYLLWSGQIAILLFAFFNVHRWWSTLPVALCIGIALFQLKWLSRHQI